MKTNNFYKLFILLLSLASMGLNAQDCSLTLDQLLDANDLSEVEFETFALSNGYTYNHTDRAYQCDQKVYDLDKIESIHGEPLSFLKISKKERKSIQYAFFDKLLYLEVKGMLDSDSLVNMFEEDGYRIIIYKYKGHNLGLKTAEYGIETQYIITFWEEY